MVFKKVKAWFSKAPTPEPVVSARVEGISDDVMMIIPHPEEPPNPSQTADTIDIASALERWLKDYNVPEVYKQRWREKIVIHIDPNLSYPAATYEQGGIRHLTIRPEWINSGVIAHEQAHTSYAELTEEEKKEFSSVFKSVKSIDPLISYLFSINSYGLTNDIEGHAEVYRYLGDQMPELLKKYYPKLYIT